jgi:hypothetical protein
VQDKLQTRKTIRAKLNVDVCLLYIFRKDKPSVTGREYVAASIVDVFEVLKDDTETAWLCKWHFQFYAVICLLCTSRRCICFTLVFCELFHSCFAVKI